MKKLLLLTVEERMIVCRYCSKNMRRMRKEIGMRQEELAFALGTTQRHISEIENGKAKVSWTLMLAFSTLLVRFPELWKLEEERLLCQADSQNGKRSNADNPADVISALHNR